MPRLLDLFCGAGGCSAGYARAGFDVVGVDVEAHPSYPFPFVQADAMTYDLDGFDVVHASPPCQTFTRTRHLRDAQGGTAKATDLLTPLRPRLAAWAARTGGAYVIENVPGAPMVNPITVCGSSFGLRVRRHRLFESNVPLWQLDCQHLTQELMGRVVGVYGSWGDDIPDGGTTAATVEDAADAMGIDWMRWRSRTQEWNDLKEAIPPAYTQYIGEQLLDVMARVGGDA